MKIHLLNASCVVILFAAVATTTTATKEDRRVSISVTTVVGRNAFLSKGRDHGLEPGQLVRLFPVGAKSVVGVIRTVSSTSSRVEMPVGVMGQFVGTTGWVTVTPWETAVVSEGEDTEEVPTRIATGEVDDRDPDLPILNVAFTMLSSKRPPTVNSSRDNTILFSQDRGEVRVTSVAGRSVFLDKGRDYGIRPGLRVQLFPVGAPSVEGVIRDVSSHSSRAEMSVDAKGLIVGIKGLVTVPTWEIEAGFEDEETENTPTRTVPEHPAWTRQKEDLAPDQPLLAKAYSVPGSERASTVKGRIYSQLNFSQDRSSGRSTEFVNARLGLWTTITNPLGRGGRLLIAGQSDYQSSDLGSFGSDSETDLILDRLSYAVGGEEYAPYRFEVGRFFSIHAPELGLIDGVEGVLQLENGFKLGAGVGAYLRSFPTKDWGDDVGFHLFMNYVAKNDSNLNATVGYQKTWHRGGPDRDLVFGRVNVQPTKQLWFYGSWKIDVYSGSDPIKGNGADLTETYLQMRYSPSASTGATVSYSRFTWPELDRREYVAIPASLIQNGEVNRMDVNTWWKVTRNVRLSGRVNYWEDQDNDGSGGELNVRWSNAFNVLTSLEAAVILTQSAFDDGIGYRLRAHQRFGVADAFLGYEVFNYKRRTQLGGRGPDITRHSLRAGVNWHVRKWSYNLSGDYYFSDSEDVISLGGGIQYRF